MVHDQHGVGRYVQMAQRTVQGATREYLLLEYAPSKRGQPGDRLFVPTDQLDQVTRYVGGEQPALDKLGGGDWAKRKGRARRAVRQIAAELIKLYAARQATKGHAFGPDTPWQRELEEAFPYVETPDQLSTIDDVKQDMERVVPMDRLVCGDVGYGKTEIAVRAAFKAVQDGKQVAVLVPTTLLVQQHTETFSRALRAVPGRAEGAVAVPDRRRGQGGARRASPTGSIDVVIGTHRLLAPETRFKNLGLVVVDEEQRFGVEHKEQLKHLRAAVDVLSMSATPIPRTLEMAITGIREMSTIATPPEERHPVLSFVGGYDDGQVTAALRRELLRDGQVFYIHNRVQSMERAADQLRKLVPEARIATAHGQMGEHRLEQVMVDFWEKRFDVLVCTTIVESGPRRLQRQHAWSSSAPTRSGCPSCTSCAAGWAAVASARTPTSCTRRTSRSPRPRTTGWPPSPSTPSSVAAWPSRSRTSRSAAPATCSAASSPGTSPTSGSTCTCGSSARRSQEFRGEGPGEEPEGSIELPVDAHLPHDYVPSERLRLEAYKQLAAVRTDAEVDEIRAELRRPLRRAAASRSGRCCRWRGCGRGSSGPG